MLLEQKTIQYQGKRVFEKVVMAPDFKRIPKFFAEKEACFLYLNSGAFRFRTPTKLLTYQQKEAMLAKCGNYFIEELSRIDTGNPDNLSVTAVFFYPEIIRGFFKTDLSLAPFRPGYDVLKVDIAPLMKSYLESIDFLLDNPAVADEAMVQNKLKELLLILSKSVNAASISSFVNSLFDDFVYDFNEVIQNNLFSNLSLEELARLCNCSLATFKRKFTEQYLDSPAHYILIRKLEKAARLLENRSIAISDIAYDCGFESVPGFNKAFKKEYGKNPTGYRLSQKDN